MCPDTLGRDTEAISAAWKPVSVKCQVSKLESELGPVLLVAVKFDGLPDARVWKSILDAALTQLHDLGAIVAWAGGEDCTWSPDVLDPESGAGNVLAAKYASTGFLCNANLDEPIEFLDDSQLASLRSFVKMNVVRLSEAFGGVGQPSCSARNIAQTCRTCEWASPPAGS